MTRLQKFHGAEGMRSSRAKFMPRRVAHRNLIGPCWFAFVRCQFTRTSCKVLSRSSAVGRRSGPGNPLFLKGGLAGLRGLSLAADFYQKLRPIMTEYLNDPRKKRILMNYIGWDIVSGYVRSTTKQLRNISEEYFKQVNEVVKVTERWKDC